MSDIEKDKARAWDLLSEIVTTYERNVNDDEGDKYLSNSELAMEIIGDLILGDQAAGLMAEEKAKRDGWINP